MLMTDENAEKIVKGLKTQTRRPIDIYGEVRANGIMWNSDMGWEQDIDCGFNLAIARHVAINKVYVKGRLKYAVGREYTLQYGRGKPTRLWQPAIQKLLPYADYVDPHFWQDMPNDSVIDTFKPLKIRVTKLSFEDVRNISLADAHAEGFDNALGFWKVWTGFYDKPAHKVIKDADTLTLRVEKYLQERPNALYQAVAINFEVVK